jgi:hypothetical protein
MSEREKSEKKNRAESDSRKTVAKKIKWEKVKMIPTSSLQLNTKAKNLAHQQREIESRTHSDRRREDLEEGSYTKISAIKELNNFSIEN